jgi:hypothetical protein
MKLQIADCRLQIIGVALLLAVGLPVMAHAQGCTMCYTAAAAQSEQGKAALNAGIFWLLTPAVGLFCGVVILARKHRAWWEKE